MIINHIHNIIGGIYIINHKKHVESESFLGDPDQITTKLLLKHQRPTAVFSCFHHQHLGSASFHEKTPTIAAMAIETKAEPCFCSVKKQQKQDQGRSGKMKSYTLED